jgi:NAD(P)H-quinone oxidoreductase subunit 5
VNDYTLTGIINKVNDLPQYISLIAALCIITAAIIQSAISFHRWLLSAMTAPTPASALMHADLLMVQVYC